MDIESTNSPSRSTPSESFLDGITHFSCHGVTHFGKQLVVRLRGPFGKAVVKGRYSRRQDSANPELELDPTDPSADFERRVEARISDFLEPSQIDPYLKER